MTALLVLDQGTTSTRALVFDAELRVLGSAQRPLQQYFPAPGLVEHDPLEIWQASLAVARAALAAAGLHGRDITGIGLTNQRETAVLWARDTGEPVHRALVWQDRRTAAQCAAARAGGAETLVREKTGLVLDPYFSASKLQWLLDNVPDARRRAERGELAFGTIDSWLIWHLTEGREHLTDASNASRTMLFNIHTGQWDEDLLRLFDIPRSVLPEVRPSSGDFGHTTLLGGKLPIGGVAGDQQASLFGQACFRPGLAKNTYGTGCFMLMHTGDQAQASHNGLLTTAAAQPDTRHAYALEGSVFIGGAVVQWLRDGLQAIRASGEVQQLAESVPDAGGVVFVPAFTGLGAPYWAGDARGAILGLTRGSTVAHIARAALESIAFQSAALLAAMSRDAVAHGGSPVSELRVDGGACANDLLMQIQADLLGIPVVRPKVIETTALGAAYLAGLATGVYRDLGELEAQWQVDRRFLPTLSRADAAARMARWEHAVRQTLAP